MTIGIYADSKQQGPPFDPTQLTGLRVWFDAADSSSITQVAGAVSQWNDKSGNNFHVSQATGANQPVTGTTNINGKNTLNFNGTSQYLSAAPPLQIVNPTTGEWSCYSVIRTRQTIDTRAILDQDAVSGAANRCAIFVRTGTTNIHAGAFDNTGVLTTDAGSGLVANVATYTSGIRRATEVEAYRAGVSAAPTAVPGTPQTNGTYNLGVGGSRTGGVVTGWWPGEIGELVVYNVAHDTTDRVKVQNYLKAKWGL